MIRIEQIMQDEGPIVQAYWRTFTTAMDKKVKGFELHPTGYLFAHRYAVVT